MVEGCGLVKCQIQESRKTGFFHLEIDHVVIQNMNEEDEDMQEV